MVAETDARNAPTGSSERNEPKPTSSLSANPESQVDSDTTKSNRRDDGNRHANRKLNSNGRRRGQDSKGRGNGRGGDR